MRDHHLRRPLRYIFGTGEVHFLVDGQRRYWPLDSVGVDRALGRDVAAYLDGLRDGGEITFDITFERLQPTNLNLKEFVTCPTDS